MCVHGYVDGEVGNEKITMSSKYKKETHVNIMAQQQQNSNNCTSREKNNKARKTRT